MIRGIQLLMNVRKDGGLNMLKRNWRWIVALLIAFYIRVEWLFFDHATAGSRNSFIIWGLFGSSKKKKRPAEIPRSFKRIRSTLRRKRDDPKRNHFFRQTMNQTKDRDQPTTTKYAANSKT